MKSVLLLALVSLTSANAFALPKNAKILTLDVDSRTSSMNRYNGGSITVDPRTREAGLYLTFKCPRGQMCPAVVIRPYMLTLEITKRVTNGCGAVIYTAESDRRMVDGLREKLVIVDNAGNKCRNLFPAVSATYEQEGYLRNGGHLSTRSEFTAEAFISPVY